MDSAHWLKRTDTLFLPIEENLKELTNGVLINGPINLLESNRSNINSFPDLTKLKPCFVREQHNFINWYCFSFSLFVIVCSLVVRFVPYGFVLSPYGFVPSGFRRAGVIACGCELFTFTINSENNQLFLHLDN